MGLLSKFIKQVVNTTAENVAEKEADKVAAKLADAVEQKLNQAAKDAKEAEASLAEAAAGMKEAEEALKEAENDGSLEQAFSFLGALAGAAKAGAEKQESAAVQTAAQAEAAVGEAGQEEVTAPGQSWGPTMPAEENQYNFPGTPVQYFEKILAEDFPACRLEKEEPADSKATVFTLWQGEQRAAVIELLNKNSVRNKLRRDCREAGIPYTRFYYDAPGWWNTRVYVKERITKAMAGEI